MADEEDKINEDGALGSLENSLENPSQNSIPESPSPQKPKLLLLNRRLLIILAIIIVLIVLAALGFSVFGKNNKQTTTKTVVINTQSLSNGTLNRVTSQLGNSGKVNTQLTINPDTIFKNNVEIQGKTSADGDLQVAGNALIEGTLSVKKGVNLGSSLSVAGQITATSLSVGSISLTSLNLSGDVNFAGHIIPTGVSPSITASVAAAGGTATLTGNDTAGTITVNIGGGRTLAGELAIITFHTPFATTPKIELTPVNSAASQIFYYVSQSPKFFTIDCSGTPANGASYTFNYFVTQ